MLPSSFEGEVMRRFLPDVLRRCLVGSIVLRIALVCVLCCVLVVLVFATGVRPSACTAM